MYKYLVALVLTTPWIGVFLLEGGEYGATIGMYGYPNGATIAYGCYAVTVALVAWLARGRPGRARPALQTDARKIDARLQVFGTNLLFVNAAFLVVFLFGFGAIQVWAGAVGKGEFRTELGSFGAIPNLMAKFILPALLAYAAALFRRSSKSTRLRWLLGANFALLFVIGASWGFKTTALIVLLPAILLIYWRVTIFQMLRLVLLFVLAIVAFFYQYDVDVETYAEVHTFLLTRITVIQGDVSWLVWDKYINDEEFPAYAPTLLAAVGDKVLTLFGLSRGEFYEWMLFHYDLMITYIAGVPLDQIADGHSITATPFSEGLVAGGVGGVAFFALLGGLLVGRMYAFIERSLRQGHEARAAVGASYFCFYIFAWLNGGAVVQLIHISAWVALLATLFAFKAMQLLGRRTQARPIPPAAPAAA
ncbi:hypothetical protein [Rubrivivax rivuli]|uniref:Oligosaccharide repeat unit polymerase n=1 Tax=Rubrivivax rivuli TaxID=1862385 RepID=A0A437R9I4_9BURK|nr:hypothetical protein [Rubrivivax rivuli]RVU43439.1 hypothetical protein EOE66_21115 [Rubrivivax rivuli]